MAHAKININQISKLANLPLNEDEKILYSEQLSAILDYVEQVESVDTNSVESTFNVTPNKNVTRRDTASKSLTQEDAISNSTVKKDGYIVSKGVFENE
ncbi:MAG: Asp-tRNA(Asn)/Glu-tRNA(Gln) amidotransferase subunit GatC [Candidatus Levybacteria bacterium]|nr:Asp-tRNA(Asn)/Glu-tRNA(Gln) amidotransferase subunit GatC [Candidatus Levybacteria bacterium]